MRALVLSDIHGNLAALEAIVARLPKIAPDQVAILGDHALFGPKPTETIDLIRKLQRGGALVTAGTADIGVADFSELMARIYQGPLERHFHPADIPDEVAAIFDPLGNAVHTALSFDLVGEDVLITGAGPIGIMAIAIVPVAVSVHTIVSFDFAVSLLPGWHTTIFPPYFVAGAIFSGFGMVLTLMLPLRAIYKLEDLITQYHIDCMCKITLATGTIVGYAYGMEFFIAWYGANPYEGFAFVNRAFGHYAWAYWWMIGCNVITPQFFWFKAVRNNTTFVWVLSLFVNVGMWFERFVIIVTSVYRDYLPSSWSTYYRPTIYEVGFYLGTFGLFFTCYFLFSKFFPVIAVAEIKHILKKSGESYKPAMEKIEQESPEEFFEETHHH